MLKTTLSVPVRVRDTLAAVAASRNTTMLALLEEAAERLEREEAMRQATASYERLLQEEPDSFAAYRAEAAAWERAAADGLASAASEFPEYNQ
jgi:ribosomal protein L11 methylase PrmA